VNTLVGYQVRGRAGFGLEIIADFVGTFLGSSDGSVPAPVWGGFA